MAWVLKRHEGNPLLSLLPSNVQEMQGLQNNKLLLDFIVKVDHCGTPGELGLEAVQSLSGLLPGTVLFPHQNAKPDIWLQSKVC